MATLVGLRARIRDEHIHAVSNGLCILQRARVPVAGIGEQTKSLIMGHTRTLEHFESLLNSARQLPDVVGSRVDQDADHDSLGGPSRRGRDAVARERASLRKAHQCGQIVRLGEARSVAALTRLHDAAMALQLRLVPLLLSLRHRAGVGLLERLHALARGLSVPDRATRCVRTQPHAVERQLVRLEQAALMRELHGALERGAEELAMTRTEALERRLRRCMPAREQPKGGVGLTRQRHLRRVVDADDARVDPDRQQALRVMPVSTERRVPRLERLCAKEPDELLNAPRHVIRRHGELGAPRDRVELRADVGEEARLGIAASPATHRTLGRGGAQLHAEQEITADRPSRSLF